MQVIIQQIIIPKSQYLIDHTLTSWRFYLFDNWDGFHKGCRVKKRYYTFYCILFSKDVEWRSKSSWGEERNYVKKDALKVELALFIVKLAGNSVLMTWNRWEKIQLKIIQKFYFQNTIALPHLRAMLFRFKETRKTYWAS